MTRDETKQIICYMIAYYPNFSAPNMSTLTDAWELMFRDYPYEQIEIALKTFVMTSGSAFAPTASQLIEYMNKVGDLANDDEIASWNKVRAAIGNSAYNAEREFNKLPELARKAVGSPNQLRLWATDENFNENVVASLYQKNYRTVVLRAKNEMRLPLEAKVQLDRLRLLEQQALMQLEQKEEQVLIESKDEKEVTPEDADYVGKLREILNG